MRLFSDVFSYGNSEASQIWKPSIPRDFLAEAFYSTSLGIQPTSVPFSLLWMGLAPPRVEPFCWLAAAVKISTVDNLSRIGFL